jgi:DNA-binding NtrC family response regulator
MTRAKMKILVVDDETAIGEVLETRLKSWGYDVLLAKDGASALQTLRDGHPDAILSDVCLPDANGVELLDSFRTHGNAQPVILMTAFGTIDVAVEAMKRGAADFLTKPLDHARLRTILERLEQEVEFRRATAPAQGVAAEANGFGALIGRSPAMRELFSLLQKLASTDTAVFICGESGTGKEVVARTIHALSRRAKAPLVPLNMAALPAGVIEAELFGHVRGSFTGAVASRPGAFELADGGTLFLDEIAEMPLELQPKLLRVLEDGRFRPIGAREEMRVDTRILAATNRAPEAAIQQGKLREDLYYRLNVFTVALPALRERREDIPLLAQHFVRQFNDKYGTTIGEIEDDALEALVSHGWPGNVRELRNVMERTLILAEGDRLKREHLPAMMKDALADASQAPLVLPANVTAAEAERILILETLRQVRNNKAAAARQLGVDVKTIRNKLKAYGLTADGE